MTAASPGRRARTVWVIDVRPGRRGSLAEILQSDGLRVHTRFPEVEAVSRGNLAIGICGLAEIARYRAFSEWARAAGVPVLSIAIDARVAFIGPLTLPDRIGCGNCAHERIVAAAATNGFTLSQPATADGERIDAFVAELVTRELSAIETTGVKRSHLVDHVTVASTDGLINSEHRVIPLARCRVCGGAAALPLVHSRSRSGGEAAAFAAEGLGGWVDPMTGIIPGLAIDRPTGERAGLPVVVTAARPQVVTGGDSLEALPGGWGKGLTLSEAVASAVGEGLERYSASIPDPERIVWARGEDLDGDRLDPRGFSLYSDEQYARVGFPYARFDPDLVHPWVGGRWLGGGDVWVPAVMCFLSLTVAAENLICQGTSNGLAASSTFEDAALRATLELIERDALLVAWVTGEPARRIRIDDALDPRLAGMIAAVETLGGSVELYLLPSVCGVSVLCIALGDGHTWPGATMGLAADLDPAIAARGAILELGQTGPHLQRMLQSGAAHVPDRPEEVRDLLDHATFYFPASRARAFDRLRSGASEKRSLCSLPVPQERSLAACTAALDAESIRVAVVDVTSSDLATGPFRVVRAVSPDLTPLSYGYGLDRLPVKRIRTRLPAADVPPVHPIW